MDQGRCRDREALASFFIGLLAGACSAGQAVCRVQGVKNHAPYMAANTLLKAGMSTSESVPRGAECLKETQNSVLPVRSKPPWNTRQPQTPESFYSRLSP